MSVVKPPFGRLINKSLSISNGIVGAWLFNEGSGSIVYDSSGYGLSGTFTGSSPPTWTTDVYGPALSFGGPNASASIKFPSSLSGSVTAVSCLTAAKRTADASFLYLVSERANVSGGEQGWAIISNVDHIVVHVGTAGDSDSLKLLATTPIEDLLVTINSSDKVSLYSTGSSLFTASLGPTILTSSANFCIGGSVNNTTQCFAGVISHVIVWNRILTSNEIAALAVNPFAPYMPERLFFKMI